jgi:TonB-dependent starch-binding outer membrane protein SusC
MMNNYKISKLSFRLKGALLSILLLSGSMLWAQTSSYTISGKIKDESSLPIIGATVEVENSSAGTITDIDGNFTFTISVAPGDYVLVVRSIGYETRRENISLGNNSEVKMDIELAVDVLNLSEVVVTGTGGLTEKRQLGNSFAVVQGSEITGAGAVDVTGALTGKIAGIQVMQNSGDPAGGVSVRLRSASTVNGNSDPLYFIDGVLVNNNSTNVLGVTSVVQNRLSDISPQDIERIEVIKGAAAAAIYGSRASNGVVQIFTKRGSSGKPKITFSTSINFNSLRKKRAFNDAPLDWVNAAPDTQTEATTRYDYQDMVFENSLGTDNYVSIAGGKGDTKYFSSLSYLFNEGIMKGTDYSRVAGRMRIDQKINDWASFSVGSYISRSTSNDKPNGGYGYGVLQTILFTNNQIDPAPDADGNYPQMTFYPNILEYIETFDFQQQNNRSISDLQINLAPMKGLTVNYVMGYDNAQSSGTRYAPIGTTTATQGTARTSTIGTLQFNSDINIVYDTRINSNFTSTTAVGYSWQYDKTETVTVSGSTLALGVKTTNGAATITTTDFRSQRSFWGGYIQQTFGFKDKLFLIGAARIDGSSVFGEDERTQFYPKVSGSYIISEEGFWGNGMANIFNNFKIRAAWGQAGNLTALGPFDRLTNYQAVSINGLSGLISPTRIGNPDLRPERQTETEFGFDFAMFNGRLGVEFTYYNQDIQDLLLERTLSPSTGATSRIENIGTMTNQGYELFITGVPVQTTNFKWTITGTFSSNRNEVNGIEGDELRIGNFGFSKAKNGEQLGVFKQSYYARNNDGSLLLTSEGLPQRERGSVDENGNNIIDRDANGQPTGSVLQKVIGDPNPDYIASLINELTYKNWSFRMQFDAVQGFDILSWDKRMFYRFGGGDQEAAELNGEEIRGTGRAKFGIAEAYIEDGSFTKLREISLSYLMVKPFKGMSDIRFTLSGRNLFSIDNFSSWDPEVNMDAQSNGSRGGVMGLIPIPRTIKFGITANF